jgi:hypothetical protein
MIPLLDKIKYLGRTLKNAELELNQTQLNWLKHLRSFGFVLLDSFLKESEIKYIQTQYKVELEEKLNFETPCLAQNRINPQIHKEEIDNKFTYFNDELLNRGIAFSNDEVTSYDNVLQQFRPSILKTYIPHDKFYFKTWLHPEILPVIEAYMGLRPHLMEAYIRRSFPSEYKVMNNYWHRDANNKKYLLKVFIFLSDCEIDNGPHEYIAGSLKDSNLTGYNYFSDEEVDSIFPPDSPSRIKGVAKAGSILIEDTRGLHRAVTPKKEFRDFGYAIFTPKRILSSNSNLPHYTIDKNSYNLLSKVQKAYIPKNYVT